MCANIIKIMMFIEVIDYTISKYIKQNNNNSKRSSYFVLIVSFVNPCNSVQFLSFSAQANAMRWMVAGLRFPDRDSGASDHKLLSLW